MKRHPATLLIPLLAGVVATYSVNHLTDNGESIAHWIGLAVMWLLFVVVFDLALGLAVMTVVGRERWRRWRGEDAR